MKQRVRQANIDGLYFNFEGDYGDDSFVESRLGFLKTPAMTLSQ
jgi:hypothetical protein